MDKTVLYTLLGIVAVFVVVEVILVLLGKKELAKKLVFPFVAVLGAVGVGKALAGGSSAIREENERIKRENEQIKKEHADLQAQIAARTREHEQKVADLQQKIDANDAEAARLKSQIATMEAGGAEAWFKSLPLDKQKDIWKEVRRPGLPDEFLNQ